MMAIWVRANASARADGRGRCATFHALASFALLAAMELTPLHRVRAMGNARQIPARATFATTSTLAWTAQYIAIRRRRAVRPSATPYVTPRPERANAALTTLVDSGLALRVTIAMQGMDDTANFKPNISCILLFNNIFLYFLFPAGMASRAHRNATVLAMASATARSATAW